MKSREALRVLSDVTESQWGMVTSAQAGTRGISHMTLTRLAQSEDLIRISQGVYRDAGAPSPEHEQLRADWLATDPTRLAHERLRDPIASAVVSGESASNLLGIGDLRASRSEFTTPTRKQTQRPDVRYRTRELEAHDITVREGLPVTTRERTIADLVEDRHDLSLVADAVRDAIEQSTLDTNRLTELLDPLAERNGYRKHDGAALQAELFRISGVTLDNIAKQIASATNLGALVTSHYLEALSSLPKINVEIANSIAKQIDFQLPTVSFTELLAPLQHTLNEIAKISVSSTTAISTALESSRLASAALASQLQKSVDWTALTQASQVLQTTKPKP